MSRMSICSASDPSDSGGWMFPISSTTGLPDFLASSGVVTRGLASTTAGHT